MPGDRFGLNTRKAFLQLSEETETNFIEKKEPIKY